MKNILNNKLIDALKAPMEEIENLASYEGKELTNAQKITKDLKEAVKQMTAQEARYLFKLYYTMQINRTRSANQIRCMPDEPHSIIDHFFQNSATLESQVQKALELYIENHPIGKWLLSICGVAGVLGSGLLAFIDIAECPTAGHIFSYAGLDPNRKWFSAEEAAEMIKQVCNSGETKRKRGEEISNMHLAEIAARTGWSMEYLEKASLASFWKKKKKKAEGEEVEDGEAEVKVKKTEKRDLGSLKKAISLRPHNAQLKVICWKLGESFMKTCNNKEGFYGKIYAARKVYETKKNENLDYKDQAAYWITRVSSTTDAYKWNQQGMLAPAHIVERSKRYAVKIFLSHLQYIWYKYEFQEEPPAPFPIEHLGHVDIITPPNLEIMNFDEKKIKENSGAIAGLATAIFDELETNKDETEKKKLYQKVFKEVLAKMKTSD